MKLTGFCPYCLAEVDVRLEAGEEKMTLAKGGNDVDVKIKQKYAYCPQCGQEIYVPEIHDDNLKAAQDVFIREGVITQNAVEKFEEEWKKI